MDNRLKQQIIIILENLRQTCRYWLVCLLLFCACLSQAQETLDSSQVETRTFDQAKIDGYKKEVRFQYKEIPRPKSPSLWFRLREWLWRNLWEPLSKPSQHPVQSTVYYILITGILTYAILKLINADISAIVRKSSQNKVTFAEVDENIHEMDFDQLIAETRAKQNYRRAVRLLYLQSLKKLTDKGLIVWKIDKTNHEYEKELNDNILHGNFQELTSCFEHICYGDFQIDQALFAQTEPLFQQFNSQLAQQKSLSQAS